MSSNLYSQSFGTTSSSSFSGNAVQMDRAPTSTDIKSSSGTYPLGQLWIDTVARTSWQLVAYESSAGNVVAFWSVIGGGGAEVNTLSGDSGIASPLSNNIRILGGSGVSTAAGGDVVTISLSGGSTAIDTIGVDASTPPGTDPVVPNGAGLVSITGGQVASGTTSNVIRTNSTAANTITVEIQRSKAVASSTVGDNGVSHFNSDHFSVDPDGFVGLAGGGQAVDSIGVDSAIGPGTNPVLPNISGLISVTGGQIAAATTSNAIRTQSIAGNSYIVQIQRSKTEPTTMVGSNGICHFNSSQFTVDSNGFVELAGAGIAIDSIGVQTGTNPITPTGSGLVTINGATVTAGTSPVRTDGTGSNTMAVEVQLSQAIASTDATKVGLSNFSSSHFSVDSNGFVELLGGGQAIDSISMQTGTSPITPNASGLISLNGSVVAAGTNPIRTDGTGANTGAIEVQISQAIAATDATKIGLSNFNSSHFSVDANGFVELLGGGQAIDSFIPDSGTSPVVPAANGAVTISGSGSITTVGGLNSLTTQLTGLTNHNVLVGAGTTTITKVSPSATSGVPLISQGSSADPVFGTAVVAGGGTGNTSTTAYGIQFGGTTTTGAHQSIASGTSGQHLIAGGISALPVWRSFSTVIQQFSATGTYTPTSGMQYCIVEVIGAGGGGGGCAASGAGTVAAAGGGGAGERRLGTFSSTTIGASQSVTIGTAGTGGAAGNNNGGNGGNTSFGALITANGGSGGSGSAAGSSINALGGLGGTGGSGGDVSVPGSAGANSNGFSVTVVGVSSGFSVAGQGASSIYGAGGLSPSNANGNAALGFGSGGSGGGTLLASAARSGGAGTSGYIVVTEYIYS